jgi:hypothetical protein
MLDNIYLTVVKQKNTIFQCESSLNGGIFDAVFDVIRDLIPIVCLRKKTIENQA